MALITHIARVFVGVLFIFSGFVKVIDPLGFSYKLSEYFVIFGMPWMDSVTVLLAIVLCLAEIALGVQLLLGFWKKATLYGLLGMIVFFTFLTWFSAYFNKVTDCGCFGDAIPLNPWQSFYKDVILLVLIVWLYWKQEYIKPILNEKWSQLIWSVVLAAHCFFAYWGLEHLPMIDFRAYAEGKSIVQGMKTAEELGLEAPVYATDFKLKHKETGEVKTVPSTVYSDEKLWETHDFIESVGEPYKVKDGYEPPIHDFVLQAEDGTDMTNAILSTDYIFLIIAYDLKKTDIEAHEEVINPFTKELDNAAQYYVGLTGSNFKEIEKFRHDVQAAYPYLTCDPTTLKTIVRSSPGVVLLKEGTVLAKWHHNDLPDFQEIKEKYLQ